MLTLLFRFLFSTPVTPVAPGRIMVLPAYRNGHITIQTLRTSTLSFPGLIGQKTGGIP